MILLTDHFRISLSDNRLRNIWPNLYRSIELKIRSKVKVNTEDKIVTKVGRNIHTNVYIEIHEQRNIRWDSE